MKYKIMSFISILAANKKQSLTKILFIIILKPIKYLQINLMSYVQDSTAKNCITLLKIIFKRPKSIGRLNVVKTVVLQN